MFRTVLKTAFISTLAFAAVPAQADVFTSFLEINGGGLYEPDARFDLDTFGTQVGLNFDNDPTLRDTIIGAMGSDAFSLGFAAVVNTDSAVLDLPPLDEPATWTASLSLDVNGTYWVETGVSTPLPFDIATALGSPIEGSINVNDALGIPPFTAEDAVLTALFLAAAIEDEFPDEVAFIADILDNELSLFFDDSLALILSDDISDDGFPALAVLTTDDDPIGEVLDFLGADGLLPDIAFADLTFSAAFGLEAVTEDDPIDVAEPASLALLGFGMAGLAIGRRRRA